MNNAAVNILVEAAAVSVCEELASEMKFIGHRRSQVLI